MDDDIFGGIALILAAVLVLFIVGIVVIGASALLLLGVGVHMLVWVLSNIPNWRRINERWIWLVAAVFALAPFGMFWAMVWYPNATNPDDYYNLGIMESWGIIFFYPIWLVGYITPFFVRQFSRERYSFNSENIRGMAGTVMDSELIKLQVRLRLSWQDHKIRREISRLDGERECQETCMLITGSPLMSVALVWLC